MGEVMEYKTSNEQNVVNTFHKSKKISIHHLKTKPNTTITLLMEIRNQNLLIIWSLYK